jgi:glycosyltransferase involved in cell wall biosynthesis
MIDLNMDGFLLKRTRWNFKNNGASIPSVISKSDSNDHELTHNQALVAVKNIIHSSIVPRINSSRPALDIKKALAEVLFVTPYPPDDGGIATYSRELIKALNKKFSNSMSIKVCALESGAVNYSYPDEVKYVLKSSIANEYEILATQLNSNNNLKIILIQHDFAFFKEQEPHFLRFLGALLKPIVIVFHQVLPNPDASLKIKIRSIAAACDSVIVMTHNSARILQDEYGLPHHKIVEIAYGTHLVPQLSNELLKKKYGLKGRVVLTTVGMLNPGMCIETTIDALLAVIKQNPEVIFLIIGKTPPEILKAEAESYRKKLEEKVRLFRLSHHVKFINSNLALPDLLEYLQLTDIYLCTSKDSSETVSEAFVYAMSCACPIISSPIPYAREALSDGAGILFDFQNSKQLSIALTGLLTNEPLRKTISLNVLNKTFSTVWENAAVEHAVLFERISNGKIILHYNLPVISLNHMKLMTTKTGIIQHSIIHQPDMNSGYTLDNNARALIAMCMHYKLTGDDKDMEYIRQYFRFIAHCLQPEGNFFNNVDKENKWLTAMKQKDYWQIAGIKAALLCQ